MPKPTPFATPENLKVGDTIWCSVQSMYSTFDDLSVRPYTVVDVNKSSFYVVSDDRPDARFRHSMQTGKSPTSFGFHQMTFRTKEEFEVFKSDIIRKQNLKEKLKQQVSNMSLSQLEDLDEYLN